jgi:large subunit ribosomal protein L19
MAQKLIKAKTAAKSKHAPIRGLAARVALVDSTTVPKLPAYKVGDTVRVHVRIKEGEKERLQAFEGTVIAKGNHGNGKAFTVRKMSHGVGVERIFQENSPKVGKLEVVQTGKVRRAKLYYLRGLIGKSAKIEQDVQTNESQAQAASAAAKAKGPAA